MSLTHNTFTMLLHHRINLNFPSYLLLLGANQTFEILRPLGVVITASTV